MVNKTQLNGIVEREIANGKLDPATADKLRDWASKWARTFATEREYTVRAVTTMTRNAAGFFRTGK